MGLKVVHKETEEEAYALRWNLQAMSEVIIGYKNNGTDSDYSKNWLCACHHLPLGEGEYGVVLCTQSQKEVTING